MTATRDRLAARTFPSDLEARVQQLATRRNERLAAALRRPYGQPHDPEEDAAERRDEKEFTRLVADLNEQRQYLILAEAVPPVEEAFRRGEDLKVEAKGVLFFDVASQVEKRCRNAIQLRQFVWAECRACGWRGSAQECGTHDWSAIADARAGVGGEHLTCPTGHVIFPLQTWVS
ncbi:MAG: hypothetical protein JNM43_18225 [Planctomycetaceae bacterium]|nr:hypothetical protein [Planctomycetaceae bacterium]